MSTLRCFSPIHLLGHCLEPVRAANIVRGPTSCSGYSWTPEQKEAGDTLSSKTRKLRKISCLSQETDLSLSQPLPPNSTAQRAWPWALYFLPPSGSLGNSSNPEHPQT